jgi:hypothetical protein
LLLALLVSSSTACLEPRLAQCPAEGGKPWVELESDHFVLQTDLPPEEAQKGVEYLERTRAAMLAAAWPAALKLEMPRLTVHVLADPSQFERIFPRRVGGVFSRAGDEPFIVLAGPPDSWEQRFTGLSETTSSTVKHELAHYLSSYFLLRQPRWLAEGLAQFLETLQLSKDGRTAVLGQPHLHAVSTMKILLDGVDRGVIDDFTIKDVADWEGSSEDSADWEISGRYAGSWLLVHWLYNTRPREFADLQNLLAQGDDPKRATHAVFPEFYTRAIHKTLLDYVQHGRYEELTVKVPVGALSSSERALDDAEVHVIRAKLVLLAANMARDRAAPGAPERGAGEGAARPAPGVLSLLLRASARGVNRGTGEAGPPPPVPQELLPAQNAEPSTRVPAEELRLESAVWSTKLLPGVTSGLRFMDTPSVPDSDEV